MGRRDERNRTEFGLKCYRHCIEYCPCSTHPGTEQSAMRGSLMLGMVSGMLDRLRLCQSSDGKHTQHQENRQTFDHGVVH